MVDLSIVLASEHVDRAGMTGDAPSGASARETGVAVVIKEMDAAGDGL
jgi:hypothetical protein